MYRRIVIALPAALLLTMASTQMLLARHALLSPWKGGGFGMFASVDGLPFRWVRIVVTAPERSEELAVPASLEDEVHRLITWPRDGALRHFGRSIIARERRRDRPVDAVRVEIWRTEVSRTLEVSDVLMREMTVAANDRAHDR
jgi:hypothetical protein